MKGLRLPAIILGSIVLLIGAYFGLTKFHQYQTMKRDREIIGDLFPHMEKRSVGGLRCVPQSIDYDWGNLEVFCSPVKDARPEDVAHFHVLITEHAKKWTSRSPYLIKDIRVRFTDEIVDTPVK